ncbi:hypothetical protein FFT09_21450 [Saccharomonospora piscinae]|uniref:hypothetical protein n=1 Tax=Saccharomonospora piscinae TaxID=687388 RepID=UPI00110594B7|nr:hypothetical protein [Saccharomonospora piscinae]TLW90474.1 hypothetical protein FFT09_21450 [Saccharomonospora piscinae]
MDSAVADLVDLLAEDDQRHRGVAWSRDRDDHEGVAGANFADDEFFLERAPDGIPGSSESRNSHQSLGDSEYSSLSGQQPDRRRAVDELRKAMGSGSTLDQVEAFGVAAFECALDDVADRLEGYVPREVKKALADHFWCDLLANTAEYLGTLSKVSTLIPDRVAKWLSGQIIEWRQSKHRLALDDAVICAATESVCKTIVDLIKTVDVRPVLLVVRILAILACKSPERHKAVAKSCVDPVCKHLTWETKRRLALVIEQEWLPVIYEGKDELG